MKIQPGNLVFWRRSRTGVVWQFHDVIKVARLDVASDLQDADLAGMTAGNRLELLDAGQFAFERTIMLEGSSIHDLHGAESARAMSCDPDLAITSPPDAAQQFVIRNYRGTGFRRSRRDSGGCRAGSPSSFFSLAL